MQEDRERFEKKEAENRAAVEKERDEQKKKAEERATESKDRMQTARAKASLFYQQGAAREAAQRQAAEAQRTVPKGHDAEAARGYGKINLPASGI